MTNLRMSHDYGVVLEWLRDSRKTARNGLEDHVEEFKFHRIQGEARCLKTILETNDNAPALLQKYK